MNSSNQSKLIHSKLEHFIEQAKAYNFKGYIWKNLKPSNFDNKRAGGLSGDFTTFRRQRGVGLDSNKAFHSFRKCVVRCLERNSIAENEAAEIIGHEKGFTYTVYNPDGITMKRKKELIELVQYQHKQI